MNPHDLVNDVIDSGYLAKYCQKYYRSWMDFDEWYAELVLVTVKASTRYVEGKGKWHTYVYWSWRSVRSEFHRQYNRKCKFGTVVPLDKVGIYIQERSYGKSSVDASILEGLVDALSDREKKFLLGASNAEVSAMGMTRSQFEIERRRVRRKIARQF